jgi:hypothetical protein
MIGMFVGDQNRGERFRIAPGGDEPFEGFLAGKASID